MQFYSTAPFVLFCENVLMSQNLCSWDGSAEHQLGFDGIIVGLTIVAMFFIKSTD